VWEKIKTMGDGIQLLSDMYTTATKEPNDDGTEDLPAPIRFETMADSAKFLSDMPTTSTKEPNDDDTEDLPAPVRFEIMADNAKLFSDMRTPFTMGQIGDGTKYFPDPEQFKPVFENHEELDSPVHIGSPGSQAPPRLPPAYPDERMNSKNTEIHRGRSTQMSEHGKVVDVACKDNVDGEHDITKMNSTPSMDLAPLSEEDLEYLAKQVANTHGSPENHEAATANRVKLSD